MIQWKRTRFVLSIALIAVVLLLQAATLVAQAEKFQENMQKGDTALNQRNFEAAVTAYKNAVKDARSLTGAALATASAQANLGLSRAYLGLGAFKNAIQSCDEALRHTGTNTVIESMVRNQKGLAIVSSVTKPGDPNLEKAITEFRRVMEITDQDPIVSYNLGVTLLKLNKDAEGIHELQAFVARVGNTPEANTARRLISEPRRARENFAPDFSVTTLDGEFVTLEDLKGKVVLLDFWGTWCPPCRESTPSLVRYSKRHPSEVFAIIGVAVNEPSDQGWRDYIEKNKMTWPQYLDSSRKIAALFKVNAYPTYITIDADGIIRDRRTGWNAETMSYIDDHVRKAVKAREKAGPPVLKTPERPTPASNVPTTQANPTPVQPAPRIEPLSPIPVAGVVGGVSAPATPPPPVNTITSGGVSVRGRVTRLPGAQAALRANLILPGPQPVTTSTAVGPDGSFEFVNVRPGNYNVTLSVPVPFRPIVVGSLDMTGIEFTVPPMRTVTGRVVIEGGGSLPQRLTFIVPHQIGSVTMSMLIQPDGTFNILLPEGERRLSINATGYSVRSFMHGSTELLQDPFKLSNTDTSQLVVTLTPGGTTPPLLPIAGPRGTPGAATTLPVLMSRVEPEYTNQAREARLQGTVRIQAMVRKDGTVDSIQVLQGLGMGLDEAAVAAIRQWRFRPATRDGEPVDYPVTLLVNFSLRNP
jgi:TonB family protein